MAIFKCTFRSSMLANDTNLNVILPDKRLRPPKVMYLLHGFQQHFGSWLNQSSVARYASGKNLAVVMPDGGRSFYSDMTTGEKYYSYIVKELPHFMKVQFGIAPSPQDTAVAGLSMGGYGALKIGMSNPERYKTIGAFSPACNIVKIAEENADLAHVICGDIEVKDSIHDLYRLARELSKSDASPEIYHYCGSHDFMLQDNRDFRDFMRTLPVTYSYKEDEGAHEWALWDKWIEEFINIFMIR